MTLSMCLLVDFSCIGKSDPSHFKYLKKKSKWFASVLLALFSCQSALCNSFFP